MSRLSALVIDLKPSADYRRMVWVLTLAAYAGLYYLHVPWFLISGFGLALAYSLRQISLHALPHPDVQSLIFQRNQWVIHFQTHHETYDKIRVAADSGFFLLLHFSCAQSRNKKWLVIFLDQLSQFEIRSLNILHTLS